MKKVYIMKVVDVGDFSSDAFEIESLEKSWEDAVNYAKREYKNIVKLDKKSSTIYIRESRKVIEAFIKESDGVDIYTNANIDDSIRKIRKVFGKTRVREVYIDPSLDDVDDTDYDSITTRWIHIEGSGDNLDEDDKVFLKNALCKKREITLNRILYWIFKVTKVPYHIELKSNLRVVFQSDRIKNDRIEVRFSKKLVMKEKTIDAVAGGEKGVDDAISVDTRRDITTNTTDIIDVVADREIADSYKKFDIDQISEKRDIVIDGLSVTPSKIKKEVIDKRDIERETGCSEEMAEKVTKLSDSIYEKCAEVEPRITDDVVSIVKKAGGMMYGLPYRLKQGTSLGRKIVLDTMTEKKFKGDIRAAADNIKDNIRYTAIFPIESYTRGYKSVKSELEGKGYREIRCKNFYEMFSKGRAQQKAVQSVFESPEGQLFEFQFHTVESMSAKEVNHPLYKKASSVEYSNDEQQVFKERMINISSTVPDPDGVFTILNY